MGKRYLSGCLLAGVFVAVFGLYMANSVAQSGVDSFAKLVIHADGSDQGTSFTDSSSGAKTVTNNESYDSYTKLMLKMENNVTDSAAGTAVTNNNVTFTNSSYKMGGYAGAFNGSVSGNAHIDTAQDKFGSVSGICPPLAGVRGWSLFLAILRG